MIANDLKVPPTPIVPPVAIVPANSVSFLPWHRRLYLGVATDGAWEQSLPKEEPQHVYSVVVFFRIIFLTCLGNSVPITNASSSLLDIVERLGILKFLM